MIISKVLLKDLITNHLKQENGLSEVLHITLNSMMKNERSLHLQQADGNKANRYRPGRVYALGSLLEQRIPGDCNRHLYNKVLHLLSRQQPVTGQLGIALSG